MDKHSSFSDLTSAPHRHCQNQSTALVSLDRTQTFLVTHVIHPLYGRELWLIYQYLAWGEDRVIAAIAYQNKAVVYDRLFKASSQTMRTIAADPKRLGVKIGFTSVLHTWDPR